jgi:hypothetical protein
MKRNPQYTCKVTYCQIFGFFSVEIQYSPFGSQFSYVNLFCALIFKRYEEQISIIIAMITCPF